MNYQQYQSIGRVISVGEMKSFGQGSHSISYREVFIKEDDYFYRGKDGLMQNSRKLFQFRDPRNFYLTQLEEGDHVVITFEARSSEFNGRFQTDLIGLSVDYLE